MPNAIKKIMQINRKSGGVVGSASSLPAGTLEITEEGTYDVTNYASVTVDIEDAPAAEESPAV